MQPRARRATAPDNTARRQMLLAPISITVHGSGLRWGGCPINHRVPEIGQKSVYYSPEDEEVGAYRKRED